MTGLLRALPVLVFLLCAQPLFARQPDTSIDPQLHAAALKLRTTMGGNEQLSTLLDVMHGSLVATLRKSGKLTAEAASKICDDILLPSLKAHLGELNDSIADIYARNYTLSELQQLDLLYKTPLGRKMLVTLPLVFAESREAGREWGVRVGKEIVTEHRQELQKRGVAL